MRDLFREFFEVFGERFDANIGLINSTRAPQVVEFLREVPYICADVNESVRAWQMFCDGVEHGRQRPLADECVWREEIFRETVACASARLAASAHAPGDVTVLQVVGFQIGPRLGDALRLVAACRSV